MTTKALYPLSTSKGSYIPLDVISPLSCANVAFTAVGVVSCTIPSDALLAILTSSEDVYVRQGTSISTPEDGTFKSSMMFIPKGTSVSCILVPGVLYIKGVSAAGMLHVQLIEKWAAIGLESNYSAR